MDIYTEKKKLLSIYDESSNKSLYKKANVRDKFCVFILPIIAIVILFISCIYGIIQNDMLYIIPLILLVLAFWVFYKRCDDYMKRQFYLIKNQNKDMYYHIFIDNLKANGIDQERINYYMDLLEIDNDSTSNKETGFLEYVSVIYIPGLMAYFNDVFIKDKTIIWLSLGLCLVPAIVLFKKIIFNRQGIKFNTILKYLKRRNIELKYE